MWKYYGGKKEKKRKNHVAWFVATCHFFLIKILILMDDEFFDLWCKRLKVPKNKNKIQTEKEEKRKKEKRKNWWQLTLGW